MRYTVKEYNANTGRWVTIEITDNALRARALECMTDRPTRTIDNAADETLSIRLSA